jgi:hypothetical protein
MRACTELTEALVSTIATIDPSLDKSFRATELMEEELQAGYIPLDVRRTN